MTTRSVCSRTFNLCADHRQYVFNGSVFSILPYTCNHYILTSQSSRVPLMIGNMSFLKKHVVRYYQFDVACICFKTLVFNCISCVSLLFRYIWKWAQETRLSLTFLSSKNRHNVFSEIELLHLWLLNWSLFMCRYYGEFKWAKTVYKLNKSSA